MTELELQALWQRIPLSNPHLLTEDGESVTIVRPGELNKGAGPDFLHAEIIINNVSLHGSIELHLNNDDWYHHQHQRQEHYQSVILHLSLNHSKRDIYWMDRKIPTVSLKKYLIQEHSDSSNHVLSSIPCHPIIRPIHSRAIELQQKMAAQEYFDRQTTVMMKRIPQGYLLEEGLRYAMEQSLWHLLGIPSNQLTMEDAFELWNSSKELSVEELLHSFSYWDFKSPRPASSPQKRIPQAMQATLLFRSLPLPMPSHSLDTLLERNQHAMKISRIGKQTQQLLLRNLIFPSWYIWGLLTGQSNLRSMAYQKWLITPSPFPSFLTQGFSFLNSNKTYPNFKLDQFKTYCSQKRCEQCLLQK